MTFYVGKKEVKVEQKDDKVILNGTVFDSIEEFVYFVNKLTDIAEEFLS